MKYYFKKLFYKNHQYTFADFSELQLRLLKTFIFDENWYLNNNLDVFKSNLIPLDHYLTFGIQENRDPSNIFKVKDYYDYNPDVALQNVPALYHFLNLGIFEAREFSQSISFSEWIRTINEVEPSLVSEFQNYIKKTGANSGFNVALSKQICRCFLCGIGNYPLNNPPNRESDICDYCGSTWRIRAIAKSVCLSTGDTLGDPRTFRPNFQLRALGVGDSKEIETFMTAKFSYTNTHIDRFPKLDLKEIPNELFETFDIVTCSDVLEHVSPPVDNAIKGLYSLLKPGGHAVISVPLIRVAKSGNYSFTNENEILENKETIEYYPDLINYRFAEDSNSLHWSTESGSYIDENPEIHGGDGLVLAFRLWNLNDLIGRLLKFGFTKVYLPSSLDPTLNSDAVDAGILIATR